MQKVGGFCSYFLFAVLSSEGSGGRLQTCRSLAGQVWLSCFYGSLFLIFVFKRGSIPPGRRLFLFLFVCRFELGGFWGQASNLSVSCGTGVVVVFLW
jgi:hypothetical protein